MSTSTRVLELLGLLQSRRHWAGVELASRLGISQRTLRRDVDSLQELGYPIATTRGTGGGYHLETGTALPPLVLSEDEAAAVVLGLKTIATGDHPTSADAALTAMAKIVQVLPTRIRRRIDSLRSVATSPRNSKRINEITDITVLTTIALACRDTETVEFDYQPWSGEVRVRTVHPHKIVSADEHLYLIGWDVDRVDWRTFRVDRMASTRRTGGRFAPRRLPADDPVKYVQDRIGSTRSTYRVHATVHAPIEIVRDEIGRYGTAAPIDASSCNVHISAESLDWATFCLGAIEAPVVVHGPPEAIAYMNAWGRRLVEGTNGIQHEQHS